MQIRFQKSHARIDWSVFIYEYQRGRIVPYKIMIERLPEQSEASWLPEAITIPPDEIKGIVTALKDGLAEAGFMQDTAPLEGELKATKIHLEDMRKLAKVKP